MKIRNLCLVIGISVAYGAYSVGSEKKKHKESSHAEGQENHEEGQEAHDDHEDHEEKEGKESHAGHGEEKESEEVPENVGPNKGVTSYSEKEGFKLSPEAEKLFGIAFTTLSGSSPWEIPNSAIVHVGDDKSIYKLNNGALKRLDVTIVRKSSAVSTISAKQLTTGDQILVKGTNFVRTAEIDLTSGDTGHSH